VELLISGGADVNAASNRGTTPIIVASRFGRTKPVEKLLATGADVNASTAEGWTALHHASKSGHTAIVELLIESGADTDRASDDGWTARRLAETAHHHAILELLPCPAPSTGPTSSQTDRRNEPQGNSVEDLFLRLRIPFWKAQMEAVDGLVAAGSEVVPGLLRDLQDTSLSAGHRKATATALGRIGDHRADEPLMQIVRGYWSGSDEARESARREQSLIPDEHLGLAMEAKAALSSLGHTIDTDQDD